MTENKRFKSTIMCNGLGEFEYIKIRDTDMPLYLNYKVVVDGLNVNVYGVHAPLIDVVSDEKKIRVI